MNDNVVRIRKRVSFKWVRGESGRTYLCPADAIEPFPYPSDYQLNKICVDESDNPHND